MEVLVVIAFFWVLPVFVGYAIGKAKNRHGGWWAFFLGWIGVLIVALLPAKPPMTLADLERRKSTASPKWYEEKRAELLAAQTHRACPFCKEQMRRDAHVCPHCRHESAAWTFHDGVWWVPVDGKWRLFDEATGELAPAS